MSGIVFALGLVAAAPARAADAPTPARPADDLEARHRIGIQLGGSAFVQMVYRLRLLGHSYFEVGIGGAPEGAVNASLGLVIAYSTGTRFFPYAAGGAGMGSAAGGDMGKKAAGMTCGLDVTPGCASSSQGVGFFYARAGVGAVVDRARHVSLHLDVGTWIGEKTVTSDDGLGTHKSATTRITWPMVGLAGYYSF